MALEQRIKQMAADLRRAAIDIFWREETRHVLFMTASKMFLMAIVLDIFLMGRFTGAQSLMIEVDREFIQLLISTAMFLGGLAGAFYVLRVFAKQRGTGGKKARRTGHNIGLNARSQTVLTLNTTKE